VLFFDEGHGRATRLGKVSDEHSQSQIFFTPPECFGHTDIIRVFSATNRCVSYPISVVQPAPISSVLVEVELAVRLSGKTMESEAFRMRTGNVTARSFG
jgi:hypothetical protein